MAKKRKAHNPAHYTGSGWRMDGTGVYPVSGRKTKTNRKTYPSKRAAMEALHRRGPRDHSRK